MIAKNIRIGGTVLFVSLVVICSLPAQDQSLSMQDKESIVQEAGRHLIDRYVFPVVGEQCARQLQDRLEAGAFDMVSDIREFARVLTEELYAISHDKHMRVRVRPGGVPGSDPVDPFVQAYRRRRSLKEDNFGLSRAEVLEGNVGYIDIRWFPPIEATRPTASATMQFVSNVDALIIDLRRNGGGNPATIQYICSYFFAERTHLNSLYWREGDRTVEFWTLEEVDGAKIPDVPIFVLTSRRTFSGGEEFANNLKTRKRATLIGETTGGGANPGGTLPLPKGLSIFVPTGRAINPVTGTNWEGTGVEPDILCPSDSAYTKALDLAATAANEYRERTIQSATKDIEELRKGLEGPQPVDSALEKALGKALLDETSINDLGYFYLGQEKFDMAIAVFTFNVEQFPESWNTYDSLAEAYMTKGETEQAITYYRKSLQLNPDNEGAKQNIKKMGGTI